MKSKTLNPGHIKLVLFLLILTLTASLIPIQAFAEYDDLMIVQIGNPIMVVNGVKKEIDPGRNTVPFISSGRTLLPIRALVEEMGGTVGWDQNEKRVDINLGTIDIKLWLNDEIALVNNKKVTLDVPPMSKNGRTMVPLRFVVENLGADVEWDGSTKEAKIFFNKLEPVSEPEKEDTGGQSSEYPVPNQPLFIIDNDSFEYLDGNTGRVTFWRNRIRILGEYTGFKLYFTNDAGKPDVFEFTEDGFYYEEILGKTVDINVTCVNRTAESAPFHLQFAMLDRVNVKSMWSQRQTDSLLGAPCWYGFSWDPVPGASGYIVYVSKSISDWLNFSNSHDLSGFSSMITTDTYFSTKTNTGLPNELVNAMWGEERYVVVYPLNEDGVSGPFPAYYKIPMTGVATEM